MLKKNNIYYLKRIKDIGIIGLVTKIYYSKKQHKFCAHWKQQALSAQANHTWRSIVQNHNQISFEHFFDTIKHQPFLELFLSRTQFIQLVPPALNNKESLLKQAQAVIDQKFELLGSQTTQFPKAINWHDDPKAKKPQVYGFNHVAHNSYDQSIFYNDIKITPAQTTDFTTYTSDIKMPWELSRMQHLYILGQAHRMTTTSTEQDSIYTQTFCQQTTSWIESNPFLLGPNWKCPMDVGIRAINMIWGIHFFKTVKTITKDFWQQLICSLYDHVIYLENNWEHSDKPNNHYLAELLAYVYCADFFTSLSGVNKKLHWGIKKLEQQFCHQIQHDGTSYEGSTSYHKLDTEMHLHFQILKEKNNLIFDQHTMNVMLNFLSDCSDQKGNLVQIGDNDGGTLVTGITIPIQTKKKVITTYENFGLSSINHNDWHITFRHPTYNNKQPSGHFHQDELAVTLSVNGQPIIVDPGSYLYTANGAWRNAFRAHSAHNTFSIECSCCKPSPDLFQCARIPTTHTASINNTDEIISISDSFMPCVNKNITAQRTITINKTVDELTCYDQLINYNTLKNHTTRWQLIFHPTIEVKQKKNFEWIITAKKYLHFHLSSSHLLRLANTFYSPTYGIKQPCQKLELATTTDHLQTIIKRIHLD